MTLRGPEALSAALADGATALTGSRRLARALRDAYAAARVAAGETVWAAPRILAFEDWVAAQGLRVGLPPRAARGLEEAAWAAAIAADEDHRLDATGLARVAADAARIAAGWQLADPRLAASGSEACTRFLRWRSRCEAMLAAEGAAAPWSYEAQLAAALADEDAADPLVLCGLEELDPQREELITALARQRELRRWEPGPRAGSARRLGADDPRAELELAVRWAAARLREDPGAQLALVVPDLEARRDELVDVLDRVLEPARLIAGATAEEGAAHTPVYDLSLGPIAALQPRIAAALDLLAVLCGDGSFARVARLLRQPTLLLDRDQRAQVELELRRRRHPAPGWRGMAAAASRLAPELAARLDAIAAEQRSWPRRALPSDWSGRFDALVSELLPAAAGPAALAAADAWSEALAAAASLDGVHGQVTPAQALTQLRRRLSAARIRPQGRGARLQVMGLLELAGLRFDQLWVLGMSDTAWPRTADPNPLLPVQLQREAEVPQASPERELAFASRVTEGLLASADEVIVSWSRADGGELLRPSPLILALDELAPEALAQAGYPSDRPSDGAALEAWQDDPGPPLAPGTRISGGSYAVQEQSLCPFRGYARARLDAASLERPPDGIPPMERGSAAHAALEAFWAEVGGSQGLAELDDAAVARLLDRHAEVAYGKLARRRPDLAALLAADRALLVTRAASLINSERERPAFRTEAERGVRVTLGGAQLEMKIDRVDRMDDGRVVITDYKTGRQDESWYGPRPGTPQLPLYAISQGPAVAAVAFASLHPATTGFIGVAAEEGLLPGLRVLDGSGDRKADAAAFPDQVDHWREVLSALGEELIAGRADVEPTGGDCGYCDLAAFCRIADRDALAREPDDG